MNLARQRWCAIFMKIVDQDLELSWSMVNEGGQLNSFKIAS